MSKGGGGGGGGGGGAARGSFPEDVRKTIQTIRETTGKQHSDEDIYSVLKDCAMDPNETAQKLLYLDTFHEVKRRRDKKKEVSGMQGRGNRGRQGNFSSKFNNSEAFAGRNGAPRREYGINHMKEGGSAVQKRTNKSLPARKTSNVTPNGPTNLPNGSSSHDHGLPLPEDVKKPSSTPLLPDVPDSATVHTLGSVVQAKVEKSPSGATDLTTSSPPTALNSNLAPSVTLPMGATSAIKNVVLNGQSSAEKNHIQGSSSDIGSDLLKNDKAASRIVNSENSNWVTEKSNSIEKNMVSEPLEPSSWSENGGPSANGLSSYDNGTLEDSVIPLKAGPSEESKVTNGHVIFPNGFKVSETFKSGLTFGSFGANAEKHANGNDSVSTSTNAIESLHGTDETAREPSSSNESESSALQVDQSVLSGSTQHVLDKVPHSGSHLAPNEKSKGDQWSALGDQSKQDIILITEGNQKHSVQVVPNNGLGVSPTLQGGHLLQFEGNENQARDVRPSSVISENSMASSSPSPSPTPPMQNSVAASPQLLFRPPYPPNYLTYGHYYNPYLLPMHQFLSHNGLPQQLPTGNAYSTSAANAPGVKFPIAQFKPGTGGGNITPVGFPPFYNSYGSSPISFGPGPPVTSGSPATNEELSASQLKESQIYTTGPMGDASAWIPPPAQDISSLQHNSMYHHLPSQAQHLTVSPAQPGHGPFPGIYPPMTAASAVNPFLQQSQAASAAVETGGATSVTYQQAQQLAHMNWSPSY